MDGARPGQGFYVPRDLWGRLRPILALLPGVSLALCLCPRPRAFLPVESRNQAPRCSPHQETRCSEDSFNVQIRFSFVFPLGLGWITY